MCRKSKGEKMGLMNGIRLSVMVEIFMFADQDDVFMSPGGCPRLVS